jgi:hypothetical protein
MSLVSTEEKTVWNTEPRCGLLGEEMKSKKCRQLNHDSSYGQPTYHYTDQAIPSQDNVELKYQVNAHHYD